MWTTAKRIGRAGIGAAVLVATIFGSGMASAQWQQRYDEWRQDRNQRYQQWRASENPGEAIRGIVDLFSGDAEPGQYDVRLPLGVNFRVNVDESPRYDESSRYGRGRAPYAIDSVLSLAANIRQSLSFMHSRARQFGSDRLADRVDEALDQIERVIDAARSDSSMDTIRERVTRFDRTWHDLEASLRNSNQIGPRFRRQIDQMADYDNRLHRVVSISPSRGYDRIEAVAIARRMEQLTGEWLNDLEYRARPGAGIGRVMRGVRDAHRQAEDLYAVIRQGESYEAVRDEFQQFDRAWHDAVDVARGNQNLSSRMWQQHSEIDRLDTRLHDILRVESPIARGKRTWVDRARSLALSTDDLYQQIRYSRGRSGRVEDLRDEAEDVAVAAEDFYRWFEAGNRDMEEARDRVHRISDQYEDLADEMDDLRQSRYPELFYLARQVDQKLQRLEERFAS